MKKQELHEMRKASRNTDVLNETRKYMRAAYCDPEARDDNLGWCKPLYFKSRKMWLVLHDDEVDGDVEIDGILTPFESLGISLDDLLEEEDWYEDGCYECPWFMDCCAMDD